MRLRLRDEGENAVGTGRALKRNAPLVKSVLTVLGAPALLVNGIDLAIAATDRAGLPANDISPFADRAARELSEYEEHEFTAVGDADKEAIDGIVARALARTERGEVVQAALRGNEVLAGLILDTTAAAELADVRGEGVKEYLRAVLGRVCVLIQGWLRDPEALPENIFEGLGEVLNQLAALQTRFDDRFDAMDEGYRRIIELLDHFNRSNAGTALIRAGERPRLATDFVIRDEMEALRSALSGSGRASVCALQGMRGVGKSQLASAFAQECELPAGPS